MKKMTKAGGQLAAVGDENAVAEGYERIGEVARRFGVSLRTLRFYEDKGLLTPVREGTTRLYSARDISRLKLIMMGRRVGFSLREVKQVMDLYDPASGNQRQIRVLLEKSERQLVRLERQRAEIDEAIGELRELVASVRSRTERKVA